MPTTVRIPGEPAPYEPPKAGWLSWAWNGVKSALSVAGNVVAYSGNKIYHATTAFPFAVVPVNPQAYVHDRSLKERSRK